MSKQYSALRERMETRTLDNGLRICYLPKEGFSKTFAILATNFGSVDASFTCEGRRYDTPAGVAHFLEHKMFEDQDGNALQKFARTGASPNAFTSQTMTAYHFSCTDRFEENLEILLKFVFTPYFTEENVQKEHHRAGDRHDGRHPWLAGIRRPVPGAVPHASGPCVHRGQHGEHRTDHAGNAVRLPPGVLQPEKHGARHLRHRGF